MEYDLTQGPELTGNYFEVSIMSIGQKDIGIGLADRTVFPADSRMPGWIDGSYGILSLSFLVSSIPSLLISYSFLSLSLSLPLSFLNSSIPFLSTSDSFHPLPLSLLFLSSTSNSFHLFLPLSLFFLVLHFFFLSPFSSSFSFFSCPPLLFPLTLFFLVHRLPW